MCSVRFMSIRAMAENTAERSWREHPARLSLGDIAVLWLSAMDDWENAIRKPPKLESRIVGHSKGGNGLWRRNRSNIAMIIGVRLEINVIL